MVVAVIQCAPHDFSQQLWGTGLLALEWIIWADRLLHQEETGFLKTIKAMRSTKLMRPILVKISLADSVKSHFNGRAPWFEIEVDNPDTSVPFYDKMKFGEALDRTTIPMFLIGGWQDLFVKQTVEQYTRLSEREARVALLMGGWNHMQVGMDSKTHRQPYGWIEQHLAKGGDQVHEPGVQYFLTGAKLWRDVPSWPPPTTWQVIFLRENSELSSIEPSLEMSTSSFAFDPSQPTPTIGGNLLLGGGYMDDTALAARSDVLTFTSEPLETDTEVLGKVTIELRHSSDALIVDLAVRVSEVNMKGRSHNVTETCKRLNSRRTVESIHLGLDDCAHRFAKGNRIRSYIAGASHPRYAMIRERSTHTIHHGFKDCPRIPLPVAA